MYEQIVYICYKNRRKCELQRQIEKFRFFGSCKTIKVIIQKIYIV